MNEALQSNENTKNVNTILGSGKHKSAVEKTMQIIFTVCGLFAVVSVGVISLYMIISGWPIIQEVGLFNFLFGTVWEPSESQFGILAMILSSIMATAFAVTIGTIISVLTAVFLAELAPKKLADTVRPAVELLSGIPSIVYGLLGAILIVPMVKKLFDLSSGATMLSAIIVLSIMVLPTIISISETALRAVPKDYKEASLALGATPIQTIFKVLIPAGRSGIVAGIVLGTGRAIGETMAIIMVAGNAVNMPGLLEKVRFLTTGVVMEWSYSQGIHRQALLGIGLVLFVFIMIINFILNVILKKGGVQGAK